MDFNCAFRVAVFDIHSSDTNIREVGIVNAAGFLFGILLGLPGLEIKGISFRCDSVGHLIAAIDHSVCKPKHRIPVIEQKHFSGIFLIFHNDSHQILALFRSCLTLRAESLKFLLGRIQSFSNLSFHLSRKYHYLDGRVISPGEIRDECHL
jgi:hypothetical protein